MAIRMPMSSLKPGNVVSIRQLAGWQDIGASVTITGEVEHAGSYGIEQGERLSSALKRAGGFREDAYPAAAVLERVQVRELGEQARQQMIQRIETTPVNVKSGDDDRTGNNGYTACHCSSSATRFSQRFAAVPQAAGW